jgi:cell division protein FtsL
MRSVNVLFALLLAAVLGSAIALVYARHQQRTLFAQLERYTAERDDLDIEWGLLQTEQSTWADAARVEQRAVSELDMVFPKPADIVVITR